MFINGKNNKLNDIRNQVHPQCVACSLTNANGLHLTFDVADDENVKAKFQYDKVKITAKGKFYDQPELVVL
jgi:hypothetical protein